MKIRCTLGAALPVRLLVGCEGETESAPEYGLLWPDEFDLAANASLDGAGNLAVTAREQDYGGQSYGLQA